MRLALHKPEQPLRAFVKSMILYEGYTGSHQYEMLLPDGNAQLVIALDSAPRVLHASQLEADFALNDAWVTGVQMQRVTYQSERNATSLSIQFEQGGLFALTTVPASYFTDNMVLASDVLGNWVGLLREQLATLPFEQRMACAERCLYERLGQIRPNLAQHPHIGPLSYAVSALRRQQLTLRDICRDVGYSQKRLIEIFRQHIGVSPKKYARLLRFDRTLYLLNSGQTLSHVAQQAAYYDQAHMSNEFRAFASITPDTYRRMTRDYPHVLPTNAPASEHTSM